MSPALSGSSAIRRFEGNDAIEICDEITFEFYTGLPQMVYLQCPGFLAQFFKKLEWLLLYTHWEGLIHFVIEMTSMSTNIGKQKGAP